MAVRSKDTVDLVSEIVGQMTPEFLITNVIDNSDGTYTLETLDTYWLHSGQDAIIDGSKYEIVGFIINESITIKDINSAGQPVVSFFTIPAPFFIHGKTVKAAKEHAEEKDPYIRMPFVWLYEILEATTITDVKVRWGLESSPVLYFMDEAQSENWTSADHKRIILEPMRQMVEYFFFIMDKRRDLYGRLSEYDSTPRANWGKFIQDRGALGRFFHDSLSGHEVSMEFKASKKACDPRTQAPPIICALTVTVETTGETFVGLNDGTANAIPAGETSPVNLTYSWTGPNGFTATTKFISSLEPGTYVVTVIDSGAENCQDTAQGVVQVGMPANPSDAANPAAWWDQGDQTTVNDGLVMLDDPMSKVDDKFLLGHDIEQTSAGNKPIWKTTHGEFVGDKFMDVAGTSISKLPEWTIYAVITPTISGVSLTVAGDGVSGATSTTGLALSVSGAGKVQTIIGDDSSFRITRGTATLVSGTAYYISARFDPVVGALSQIQVNGADDTATDAGGSATMVAGTKGTFRVGNRGGGGSANSFQGDNFEIILYSSRHSDADRNLLNTYFKAKYPSIPIV